jgi:hypothetical protein
VSRNKRKWVIEWEMRMQVKGPQNSTNFLKNPQNVTKVFKSPQKFTKDTQISSKLYKIPQKSLIFSKLTNSSKFPKFHKNFAFHSQKHKHT